MHLLRRFLRDETGTTAIEYGLIIGIIGASLVAGAGLYGNNLGNMFNMLSSKVNIQ
jgi:pilus assembly protein Flp/PilA